MEIHTNFDPLSPQNNTQTIPEQLQNNFENVHEMTFLTLQIVKNDPLRGSKFDQKTLFSKSFNLSC